MTSLWITVFLLTLFVTAVLVYILFKKPTQATTQRTEFDLAVYRDQLKELEHERERALITEEEAESAVNEIKRRMLKVDAEKRETVSQSGSQQKRGLITAILIAIAIPALSVSLYLYLGNPLYPDQPFAERDIESETATSDSDANSEAAQVAEMVQGLADKLAKNPDDIKGWMMLGRSYMVIDQPENALEAYRRAMEVSGDAPEVAVDYAEALTVSTEGNIPQQAINLFTSVQTALPLHPKPWFYLGMAKAQTGDIRGALQEWVDLIAISPADAPYLETIEQRIEQAITQLDISRNQIKPSARAQKIKGDIITRNKPTGIPEKGPTAEQVDAAQEMSAEERQSMINGMVEKLAERLKQNPDDKQGWIMLGRSYENLGRMEEAKEAFAKADAL